MRSAANVRPTVLLLEPLAFSNEATAQIKMFAHVIEGPFTRRQLLTQIPKAHVLWVRLNHTIDRRMLRAAQKLRCIVSPTTGLNHIDLDACSQRNIDVLSLKGDTHFLQSVTGTAEHTLGLILALLRNTVPAHRSICQGTWDRNRFIGRQASDLTLGIVGVGRLGQIMCRIAKPIFKKIIASDPFVKHFPAHVERVPLKCLISTADVITLHVPSSPQTSRLIDSRIFKHTKPKAYLINTSRGDILDEKALLKALKQEKLSGAALDVLEAEHTPGFNPRRHPLVAYAKTHTNLLLTPHIGGATQESMLATELRMTVKLRRHLDQPFGT